MDRNHRLWYCLGTRHLRRHLTHALQRAKTMNRQVQGDYGVCAKTAVSDIVPHVVLPQTCYLSNPRIIIIAVYRLLSLRDFRSSTDPLLDRILPTAWTQGEQAYGFATAVIPSLMPFLMRLNTGLGALSSDDFVKETTRQESSGNYALQSLKPSQRGSMVSEGTIRNIENIRSDIHTYRCGRTMWTSNRQ